MMMEEMLLKFVLFFLLGGHVVHGQGATRTIVVTHTNGVVGSSTSHTCSFTSSSVTWRFSPPAGLMIVQFTNFDIPKQLRARILRASLTDKGSHQQNFLQMRSERVCQLFHYHQCQHVPESKEGWSIFQPDCRLFRAAIQSDRIRARDGLSKEIQTNCAFCYLKEIWSLTDDFAHFHII